MKSIVFFNNKGGVGKTTLACNLVSYLNIVKSKRVLLVDADPQCNATQAILDDDTSASIYLDNKANKSTIYDCLSPLEDGEVSVNLDIKPSLGTENNFKTDLIPGHPKMSIIEDRLSDAWSDLRARETRGYRITNWCHHLIQRFKEEYELIVFDVGPSLGALNRSIILACDYVVTPFGCDIFSLLGVQNIAGWIKAWKELYDSSITEAKKRSPEIFEKFSIIDDTNSKFRFAGYSVQQYVTKKFKDGPRPVKSYDTIMTEIPNVVRESMAFIATGRSDSSYELGHIPYLYSLVPMAQAAKTPIHSLKSSDGVVGSQYAQVQSYANLMDTLSEKLLENVGEDY